MDNKPLSVVTDFFQLDLTSRAQNLIRTGFPQIDPAAGNVGINDVSDRQWAFRKGYNFTVNPLSGQQVIIGSEVGRIYATENGGEFWNLIGNSDVALDGTYPQALAFGAPDTTSSDLGNLNSFIYAGTVGGRIFVTYNGGGGSGNQWTDLSLGLDGTPVQKIVTNPTRTSHEAYAVTKTHVYHMVDSKATGARWVDVTGNLFDITSTLFGNTSQVQNRLRNLTSIQVDWRYIIPDDPTNPAGASHPVIYVGGEGGVFRSLNDGGAWSPFPSVDVTGIDSTPTPPGSFGGLPNALITDLTLSLGEIDPTTGRPDIASGPNTLLATTYGRGAFTIRLAPIIFPISIGFDTKLPAPDGSDTGLSQTDFVTKLPQPFIAGLSEQSAFGSKVSLILKDVTDPLNPFDLNYTGINPSLKDYTDGAGRFSIQILAGKYSSDGKSDGKHVVSIQATDGSGTKGNITLFTFTLDTQSPAAPDQPDLDATTDSGVPNDDYTNFTAVQINLTNIEPDAKVSLFRDSVATPIGSRIGNGPIRDEGPLTPGVHTYYAIQEDVAGNLSARSALLTVTIDTTSPSSPTAPDLQTGSDSGIGNPGDTADNITNVLLPWFDVVATEARPSTVILVRKLASQDASFYQEVGSVAVLTAGTVSVRDTKLPASPLSDGVYTYAARQRDLANNLGPIGAELTVTIDTQGGGPPTIPDLLDASDTGPSNTDNKTGQVIPQFVVTSTEFSSRVQLLRRTSSSAFEVVAEALTGGGGKTVTLSDTLLQTLPVIDGDYFYAAVQIDRANNLGTRSNSLQVTFDTKAPAAAISLVLQAGSDTGSSNSDRVTKATAPFFDVTTTEANLTVKLYRKANGAPDSEYVVVGPTLTQIAPGVGQLQDPTAPANGIYVYAAKQTDVAGNVGPYSATVTVTYDTTPPTVITAPDLQDASDSGTSNTDNITNFRTPAFTVAATEGTAWIQLLRKLQSQSDLSYAVVATLQASSGSITDPSLPTPLADGKYSYVARQVDQAGNNGPNSLALLVTIDTTPPVTPTLGLDPGSDTGVIGDGVTSKTLPVLTGKTEALATLKLFAASAPLVVIASGKADASGVFALTPTSPLSGTYSLQVTAADIAANSSTSAAFTLIVDTAPPGAAPAPTLDDSTDSGIKLDNITSNRSPVIGVQPGGSETGATLDLYRKKLGDSDALYVRIGSRVGVGTIADAGPLAPDGKFVYSVKQTDAAGNQGGYGAILTVTIDTTPPVAPLPTALKLSSESDSGTKGDGITNFQDSRNFDVVASEAGATVRLYRKPFSAADSAYQLIDAPVVSGKITDSARLSDNTSYAYQIEQVDPAGNISPRGPAIKVTIDILAPISPVPTLLSADDSGAKGDLRTNVTRPRFTGVTDRSVTVELLDGGTVIATGVSDASTGVFTLLSVAPTPALADGVHFIQVRATDGAGNSSTSPVAPGLQLVIDTVKPAKPTILLNPADDAGLPNDGITSVRRPRIIGGGTDASAIIELLDSANTVIGRAIADSSGVYSVSPILELVDGKYVLHVRASDLAGNFSDTDTLPLQITQDAPTTPQVALAGIDDTGTKGDRITSRKRPALEGTAVSNAIITLQDTNGNIFGNAKADALGKFVVRPAFDLGDATYNLVVRAQYGTDQSVFSNVLALTIDTLAPGTPTLTLLPADDSALPGDFVTNVRKPRLVGRTEPGATVGLYSATATLLATVVAGPDGSFTLQPVDNLPLGPNFMSVLAGDAAGNIGPVGNVAVLRIIKPAGDYDGDGRSDIAVYDPPSSTFTIQYSAGGDKKFAFGIPNGRGIAVAGDYDGDSRTDITVYDPTTAQFRISYSSGGSKLIQFGIPNGANIPIPGDFDGDGKTDLAVYDPIGAKFYIYYSSNGILVQPSFGVANHGGVPIPADYDGDNRTDLAVYDSVTRTITTVYIASGFVGVVPFDIPAGNSALPSAPDYDRDGRTDFAVYDQKTTAYYNVFSTGLGRIFLYGTASGQSVPVYADFDGDAATDLVTYDAASAQFTALYSAGGGKIFAYGQAGRKNIGIPSIIRPDALIAPTALVGGPTDFTPLEKAATIVSPTSGGDRGSVVRGFLFGHPDRVVTFKKSALVSGKHKVTANRKLVTQAVSKATAHDLALENLWKSARDH